MTDRHAFKWVSFQLREAIIHEVRRRQDSTLEHVQTLYASLLQYQGYQNRKKKKLATKKYSSLRYENMTVIF